MWNKGRDGVGMSGEREEKLGEVNKGLLLIHAEDRDAGIAIEDALVGVKAISLLLKTIRPTFR